MNSDLFTVGEFSKVTGLSVKTLRFYHEKQLLLPTRVDEATGYRYYSAGQLERLNRILGLQAAWQAEYAEHVQEKFLAEAVAQTTQLPCVADNKVGSYTANNFVAKNEAIRPWLESFSKHLTDGYSLGDCLPNSRFAPDEATDSRFDFRLDKDAFLKLFVTHVALNLRSEMRDVFLHGDYAALPAGDHVIAFIRKNPRLFGRGVQPGE